MYGIFTYIGAIFVVNVDKYSSTMEHLGCHKQNCYLVQTVHLGVATTHVATGDAVQGLSLSFEDVQAVAVGLRDSGTR